MSFLFFQYQMIYINHNFIYATDDVPVVDRERGFYRCTVTRSTDLMSTSCRCFLTTFVYKTSETKFIRCTLFSVCPTSSHTVIYKCRFVWVWTFEARRKFVWIWMFAIFKQREVLPRRNITDCVWRGKNKKDVAQVECMLQQLCYKLMFFQYQSPAQVLAL